MKFIGKGFTATKASFPGQIIDLNSLNYLNKITRDGSDRVSLFADDIPSSINASQSADAKKPVLTFNAINGKPALFCDGSDDAMDLSSALPITGDFDLFFALYLPAPITAATAFKPFMSRQISALPRGFVGLGDTAIVGISSETVSVGVANIAVPGIFAVAYIRDIIPAGFNIIEIKQSGSTTIINLNGVSKTVFLHNGGITPVYSVVNMDRIFGHFTGSLFYYNGYAGHILGYNNAFSTLNSAIMYQQLLNTWS